MFKSRKRKFTQSTARAAKVQGKSSSDEEATVVVNDKSSRRKLNVNKTVKRRGTGVCSSDDDLARVESQIHITENSTRSTRNEIDPHGVFSNKDKYETRLDQDFEGLQRRYGKDGFLQGQGINESLKLKNPISRLKNTPSHAISHDDCVDETTGEKMLGYKPVYDDGSNERMGQVGTSIDESKLMYKGKQQYTDWNPMQKKDPGTKLVRAIRGPVRAPTFLRVTTRWDYEKSTCRDWRECGYCVFGDCCKYIHDRSDLKHGWELEDNWKEMNGIIDSDNDYTISSADEDEGDIPFKCFMCRKSYTEPIETLCSHYFCLKCAMTQYKTTMKCYICGKNTKGVFNPAKKILARIEGRYANDGIDISEQRVFGERSDEDVDKPKIDNMVFYTKGEDRNDDSELVITNEIEYEANLIRSELEQQEELIDASGGVMDVDQADRKSVVRERV